jgi:polyisoprenoid-binding protein YceI
LTELKLPGNLGKGDGEAKAVPFKGTLSVHGVPQPVTGTVDIERKGAKAEMDFKFNTTIPSHKIELPSFMGVTVAEDVQITVEVEGPLS